MSEQRAMFNERQRNVLLKPIDGFRVQNLDGISHLAAWDVTAHLNRVFGFEGWDKEILTLDVLYEHVGEREVDEYERGRKTGQKKKVVACSVGYRCTMRLTVRNPSGEVVRVVEDAATGTAKNQRDIGDAHDLAIKSAVSYALKRCAKDLGDQFGLSLYNKGQESACVQHVFPYETDAEGDFRVNVHADGISEGDDGFGSGRGEDAEPDPVTQPEPVRDPAPAKAKAEKPAPTPPPEQPEQPKVSQQQAEDWYAEVGLATTVDPEEGQEFRSVKDIWREVQNSGALDVMVLDLATEKQMALREVMVRRVNEIQNGGVAA